MGLGYGLVTAIQNSGLALFPLLTAAIYKVRRQISMKVPIHPHAPTPPIPKAFPDLTTLSPLPLFSAGGGLVVHPWRGGVLRVAGVSGGGRRAVAAVPGCEERACAQPRAVEAEGRGRGGDHHHLRAASEAQEEVVDRRRKGGREGSRVRLSWEGQWGVDWEVTGGRGRIWTASVPRLRYVCEAWRRGKQWVRRYRGDGPRGGWAVVCTYVANPLRPCRQTTV